MVLIATEPITILVDMYTIHYESGFFFIYSIIIANLNLGSIVGYPSWMLNIAPTYREVES